MSVDLHQYRDPVKTVRHDIKYAFLSQFRYLTKNQTNTSTLNMVIVSSELLVAPYTRQNVVTKKCII